MSISYDVEQFSLEHRCFTMATLWRRMYTALQLTVLRDKGPVALEQLKYQFLTRHQAGHFVDGVRKLGLDPSEPPAVVAGKYHYLSNILGGLRMEYIEESSRKTWIRYLAPSWGYEGLAVAVIPPSVQRMTYAGWHPRNAEALGAPGLVFVVTKVFQYGEPYGEGYFEELDHPVPLDRRIVFRNTAMSPDFDPARAPKLDAKAWPPERLHRVRRSFARGYLADTIMTVVEMYGVPDTSHLLAQAMRAVAIQYGNELKADLAALEDSVYGIATLVARLARFADEELEVHVDKKRVTIRRAADKLLGNTEAPAAIYHAAFSFQEMLARMTNARVAASVSRLRIEGSDRDEWVFEDVGRRLF